MCDQPFSVLQKHDCKMKTKRKLFDPDGNQTWLRLKNS